MDTQANNSLIKVEEFNQIMQSAPATLQRNQTSVSTCNQAGQTLLDTIEAEGVLARMNWMRRSQSIWQRRK